MKNEKKQKALKVYESTMIQAADVRRVAIEKAKKEYQDAKEKAHAEFVKNSN